MLPQRTLCCTHQDLNPGLVLEAAVLVVLWELELAFVADLIHLCRRN